MADRARLIGPPRAPDIAIVLVRHAETPWVAEHRFQGHADTLLSPRGEAQAQAVARRLADPAAPPPLPLPASPPVAIWHSPLQRAAATARAIAEARGQTELLAPTPDLIETHVGDWEGLTNVEVGERWPVELEAWRRDPTTGHIPGGEAVTTVAARARRAMGAIVTALEAASAEGPAWGIVVSHDGYLRLTLLTLLDLPLERYWSFPMAAAGITIVDRITGGPWHLRVHGLSPWPSDRSGSVEAPGA